MATDLNPIIFGANSFSGASIGARGSFNFEEASRESDVGSVHFYSEEMTGTSFGLSLITSKDVVAPDTLHWSLNEITRVVHPAYFEEQPEKHFNGEIFSGVSLLVAESLISSDSNARSSIASIERASVAAKFLAEGSLVNATLLDSSTFGTFDQIRLSESDLNFSKTVDRSLPELASIAKQAAFNVSTVFDYAGFIAGEPLIRDGNNVVAAIVDFDKQPLQTSLEQQTLFNTSTIFSSAGAIIGDSLIRLDTNVKALESDFDRQPIQITPQEALNFNPAVVFEGKGFFTGKTLIDKGLNAKYLETVRVSEVEPLSTQESPPVAYSRIFKSTGFLTTPSLIVKQENVYSQEVELMDSSVTSTHYPENKQPPYQVFQLSKNSVVDSEKDPFVFKGVLPSDSGIVGFFTAEIMDEAIRSNRVIFELPAIVTGNDIPANFVEKDTIQVLKADQTLMQGIILSAFGGGVFTMETMEATVLSLDGFYANAGEQNTIFRYEAPELSEQFWV